MDTEPKLTSPQRRYEIIGDSNDVNQTLEHAFDEKTPALFDVKLADVVSEFPVPDMIQRRKVGMHVVGMTCRVHSNNMVAFGHTTENSAEVVTVHIPKDREKTSLLYLLDIGPDSEE